MSKNRKNRKLGGKRLMKKRKILMNLKSHKSLKLDKERTKSKSGYQLTWTACLDDDIKALSINHKLKK